MKISLFQAAFDCAIDYAQNRSAFGQPIASLQTIQVLPFFFLHVYYCFLVCFFGSLVFEFYLLSLHLTL